MLFIKDASIIVRRARQFTEQSLTDLGLGFPEQLVVMYLSSKGASNQESIAQYLGLDKGAVAKTVAKLEAKGYATRVANERNRRENIVALTAQAEVVQEAMTEAYASWIDIAFEGIDEQEAAIATRVVARMAANLDAR